MKIDNYRLDMQTSITDFSKKLQKIQINTVQTNNTEQQQGISRITADKTQYSYTARELAATSVKQLSTSNVLDKDGQLNTVSHESHLEQLISNLMVQKLTLSNINFDNELDLSLEQSLDITQNSDTPVNTQLDNQISQPSNTEVAAFEFSSNFIEYETQKMHFQAQGEVTLEDGRAIDFNLSLSMNREYFKQEVLEVSKTSVPLTYDPLVLDLAGNGPSFSQMKFDFDINNDGQNENLAFLGQGSGFLVLDKNQDGRINNGSELFGGVSGQGFKELAVHDEDGNMWIDENDAVFEKLQIWHLDDNGEKQLISLKDAGVGAIYLGSNDNGFTLKDSHNNALGTIQKSGVFLKEDGQVSSISQFDLSSQDGLKTGLNSNFDSIETKHNMIQKQNELNRFVSWFGSEETLAKIDFLIEKFEAKKLEGVSALQEQNKSETVQEEIEEPVFDFLKAQLDRAQKNLDELKKQFNTEDSEIGIKFSHMSDLVAMLKSLKED
ncbi:hypothetical protein [Pseudoalteromonas denitrificans]|uniref:VCBS repeat-containing protein n=1 Tax=Pseudoalteromonas denitrificans DSM 6059 TaxID=1123010 RepID=A0A1I1TUA9_9GAMM|nr:hypothetical protein [Pseudoalteromonas denitrificans]SFD60828.1 hypothetical protein SAMN02745724_04962 [Pseudoalteromonas denitrificans DSM 6059]